MAAVGLMKFGTFLTATRPSVHVLTLCRVITSRPMERLLLDYHPMDDSYATFLLSPLVLFCFSVGNLPMRIVLTSSHNGPDSLMEVDPILSKHFHGRVRSLVFFGSGGLMGEML
jgi:hypothetical protein